MKGILLLVLIFIVLVECAPGNENVVRKGSVIKVKPEMLEQYKALHASPWESVNAKLKECNIRNYSIFYRDGYLFSYLEYTGQDWEADMAKMAADSATRAWWKLTDPCQEPVESAGEGVWWADLEEVYHLD
jgi:L-rhamnose mutarotase